MSRDDVTAPILHMLSGVSMPADENGCTCAEVLAYGPKPPEWCCVACRGRSRGADRGQFCRSCKTGLLSGEGPDHDGLCTRCWYR